MSAGPAGGSTSHGLAFLIFLSFIASFLAARAFAVLNPDVVLIAGGIHFHHFWYGLAMIVAAGSLGIVYDSPAHRRFYAVLFGLGCGLVGDEVGLLLTFGDYDSDLTLFFFVIAVSLGVMGMLFFRYRREIEGDVLSLENGERVAYLGVFIVALSALSSAVGTAYGAATLAAGILTVAAGLRWRRRGPRASPRGATTSG